jgi:hypothetical protein
MCTILLKVIKQLILYLGDNISVSLWFVKKFGFVKAVVIGGLKFGWLSEFGA